MRFLPGAHLGYGMGGKSRASAFLGYEWKKHIDACVAGLRSLAAADANHAELFFHDAVHHPQSQAGAFGGFGGEEGFEDFFAVLRRNSAPGIGYGDANPFMGRPAFAPIL